MAQWQRLALIVALVVAGGSVARPELSARLAPGAAWAQTDRAARVARFASADIERATHGTDAATGTPHVEVRLSGAAAERLRDFTTAHVGKVIDIRVDGRVISRPMIREPIAGGTFVITGRLTGDDARAMAAAFRAGSAAIELVVTD
ncbi:MAG: hypothetical protein KIT36_15705 [Alphaproteobacteria bacterium]|nr:hypothetical protein [Alphaproteobacteria bacterium]